MFFSTNYMACIYNDPKKYADLVERVAKKVLALQKTLGFQAIAFRGTSGAAMAYPISVATGIPLICVRKPTEDAHGDPVEGSCLVDIKKYLILDDFISSGNTMEAIISAIASKSGRKVVKCVGIFLYSEEYNSMNGSWQEIPIEQMYRINP